MVGQAAPDFMLTDSIGNEHRLSDQREPCGPELLATW